MQRQDGNASLSAVSVILTYSLAKLIAQLVSVTNWGFHAESALQERRPRYRKLAFAYEYHAFDRHCTVDYYKYH